jgi:L-asparaginase / beta-aspartyl-peptidase
VGASPVLGGGTYASNDSCAVACTGDGEVLLRGVLAHEVYALVKYQGLPLAEACRATLRLHDDQLRGDKGLIAIGKDGRIALEFNSNFMRRAYRTSGAEPVVALWQNE